jgi:hypothetical protein
MDTKQRFTIKHVTITPYLDFLPSEVIKLPQQPLHSHGPAV